MKMKAYEWMTTYTPQKEWIEGKGISMPLAFYLGSLGGGLYLLSLYYKSIYGMFASWLIIGILKGVSHLFDLGKPFKSWRMVLKPQTSWISRGLILVILFTALVPVQLFLTILFPGTIWESIIKVLAAIAAFGICIYPGYTLNFINAIPLWNSAILPIVIFSCGLLGGSAVLLSIFLIKGDINFAEVEAANMFLLFATALVITVFISSISYTWQPGKKILEGLLKGKLGLVFWLGTILSGLVIPIIITLSIYVGIRPPNIILFIGIAGEIIYGLSLMYLMLRFGTYNPLI